MAPPRSATPRRVTISILSVEDEVLNRALLREVLARDAGLRDARLVEATSLAEARVAIASDRFDLVILDMRLPDGDGLTLARELHARQDRPAILVLSANVQDEHRRAATDAGADSFVGKPFRVSALTDEITRLLPGSPPA
jgi:two-component system, OmpR family, KDP operon response regulator KdpE